MTSVVQSHFLPVNMYFLTWNVGIVRPSGRFDVGLDVAAAACLTWNKKKAIGEVAVLPISVEKLCRRSVNK